MKPGDVLTWAYKGTVYRSPIVCECPMCGAGAVIALPPEIVREQPDETTHVCNPAADGCNLGFELMRGSNGYVRVTRVHHAKRLPRGGYG